MDDRTRKILRKVCAQYNTGIRRPFSIDGRVLRLIYDPGNDMVGVTFEDVQNKYNVEPVWEVTPDGITQAVAMWDIRHVMDS